MQKGFYNLTSGMLSQTRRLDVIANNMSNVSTAGYKAQTYTDITFEDVMYQLTGNKDKNNPQDLGNQSYILAPSELYVDHTQGIPEETGMNLDFAIHEAEGYFAIQTANGTEYTRNGNFILDDEHYLALASGHGRVLGSNGEPIFMATDQFRADGYGNIYLTNMDDAYAGTIGVFTFADNEQLVINESGLFGANGQEATVVENARIDWKSVERSNVDLIDEMTKMITTQRALQSAAQVLKMYDTLLSKASSEVGRV